MNDIDVLELKQKIDRGDDFLFLDVREVHEYEQFNLNAKLIPLGNLMSQLDELEDYKEKEVIVHCRSGARSGNAKQLMMQSGFKNVRNVLGGVLAWQDQIIKS